MRSGAGHVGGTLAPTRRRAPDPFLILIGEVIAEVCRPDNSVRRTRFPEMWTESASSNSVSSEDGWPASVEACRTDPQHLGSAVKQALRRFYRFAACAGSPF